jgi:hypothetical protein
MRKSLLRRPSPALVVSAIALFMALGGGAYAAASSDSKQDKQIANSAAQAYFNHHIAGASVSHASSANTAASATTATNATNATNASNATDLGGQPASAYMPANRLIQGGVVNLTAPATLGQSTGPQTLLTAGPFTVTGTCTNAGAQTTAKVDASSTAANSSIDGLNVATAGASQQLDTITSSVFEEDSAGYDYNAMLLTPAGQAYTLIGVDITNPAGAPGTCRFDLAALLLS